MSIKQAAKDYLARDISNGLDGLYKTARAMIEPVSIYDLLAMVLDWFLMMVKTLAIMTCLLFFCGITARGCQTDASQRLEQERTQESSIVGASK